MEKWIDIKEYQDKYQVSDLGKIRSKTRYIYNQNNEYIRHGVVMKQVDNGNGYKGVSLCKNGKHKRFYIHRLVAQHFLTNPTNYNEVNHIDRDKSNNNVLNLEWCSSSQNKKHAFRVGLKKPTDVSGSRNPKYKHGKLIRVDTQKTCVICGNFFIARLAHHTHCSKRCVVVDGNQKRSALKEQTKMDRYNESVY